MSLSSRAAALAAPVLFTLALAPSPAAGAIMNFDNRPHGEVIDNDYLLSKGVTVSAVNGQGGPNLAISFDTNRENTDDADLEFNWSTGNRNGNLAYKILIIAENDTDVDGDGRIDRPDDQGSQPHLGSSGQLIFDFLLPQRSLGLDLIDVETGDFTVPGGAEPAGEQVGFIAFYLGEVELRRVSLNDFIDPGSSFFDRTVVYADNSANRIQPMTAEELNIVAFDKLVIDMGMCYGIDNIEFQEFEGVIPEPSGMAVMGLGAALLARRGRRSRRN